MPPPNRNSGKINYSEFKDGKEVREQLEAIERSKPQGSLAELALTVLSVCFQVVILAGFKLI